MMSIINQQQKADLAGKTKLTAVSIYMSPHRKVTRFLMLQHNEKGNAILPMVQLNHILGDLPRGSTYSVG